MASFTMGEEKRHDNYQRKVYENIQHNQRRRMQLQRDFQSQQRNHRLNRAAWLQSRWLEISEQERKAQIHNQKLLQDFQRAQDTLDDMLARTEAMNSIRVQYKQYLEESFPQWQKRLKDIQASESKQVQQHLQNYIQQMEEDEVMKTAHRCDFRRHPLSSNSPNLSQTSHTMQNTQAAKDIKQNAERCNPNGHHPYSPPTWLTGLQSFVSGLPRNNIPKDYKNLQNIQALNHPYYCLPGDSLQPHSPVLQKSPSMDHLCAGIRQGFMPTAHFTPAGASWPRLPVLSPNMWGLTDVPDPSEERIQRSETDKEKVAKETLNPYEESFQRLKHKRNGKESDRSELDCRPVRLSTDHEESSEGSAVSSEVVVSGRQKREKKNKDGTKSHSTENDNSQGSSSMSQDASDCHSDTKISKIHKKTSKKCVSKESIVAKKNVGAVMQDEEEERSQEILPSSLSLEKKDGSEGSNIGDGVNFEGNDDSHVAEKKICDREVEDEEEDEEGTGGEEEAELDDEAQGDDEEESEKVIGKRDGIEPRDREEPEEEDVPEDISDSEDGAEATEEEERENSFQDGEEARKTSGEEDKKVNSTDKDIHKSLEELYAETEDEDVCNQETEDDEDEVVVEKAYPWSRDPSDDHTKCTDDDDEDIEGLLNPVNSQTQEDDVEETNESNDQRSGSKEDDKPQKNHPAAPDESWESDDEFDHFYD